MQLWKGDDNFTQSLDKFVRQPVFERELFNPALNPIRRLVLVYGRPGVGKKEAVADYCSKNGITHHVVTVDFARTSRAIQEITQHIENQRIIINTIGIVDHNPRVDYVIVIDHFDRLVYEPDNEATMFYMLDLAKIAAADSTLFVCLSDKLASEETQSNLAATTRSFRQNVLKQFSAVAYLTVPHSPFRQAAFKDLLEKFVEHSDSVPDRTTKIILDLSEGDYIKLADYSAFATSEDIVSFTQKLFYDILSPDPPPLCRPNDAPIDPETNKPMGPIFLNMTVIEARLSNASGNPHILAYDPRIIENMYSIECGRGPLVGMSASNKIEKPELEHTNFSTKNVEQEDAEAALKKKKKRRKKRVKEEEEEEEEPREDEKLWREEAMKE